MGKRGRVGVSTRCRTQGKDAREKGETIARTPSQAGLVWGTTRPLHLRVELRGRSGKNGTGIQ